MSCPIIRHLTLIARDAHVKYLPKRLLNEYPPEENFVTMLARVRTSVFRRAELLLPFRTRCLARNDEQESDTDRTREDTKGVEARETTNRALSGTKNPPVQGTEVLRGNEHRAHSATGLLTNESLIGIIIYLRTIAI